MRITIVTTFFCVFIAGCASGPYSQKASKEKVEQAKSFSPKKGLASIYIKQKSGLWNYSVKLLIDKKVVGIIEKGQYLHIGASPGTYSLKLYPVFTDGSLGYNMAKFDLDLSEGSLALIECDAIAGFGVIVRTEKPVLQEFGACQSSVLTNESGVRICLTPYKIKNISGEQLNTEPWSSCNLVSDRSIFNKSILAQADVEHVTNPEAEFEKSKKINTVQAYKTFVKNYPSYSNNHHLNKAIATLKIVESTEKNKQKIDKKLARDAELPLQVKKDKYMLALTSHLKNKEFKASIFYFELLETLDVPLSPSFDFFWGESLLRIGRPEGALKKLYSYVSNAGSNGKYYTRALELSIEAEKNNANQDN